MKQSAIIISGDHAGQRISVTKETNQVTLGDCRYSRVAAWMVGGVNLFAPALLSFEQLMELLVLSYEKLIKLENESI